MLSLSLRQTKKNHREVAFFCAPRITAWLARRQQVQRQRERMRQQRVLVQVPQLLQRELVLVQRQQQELQRACCKQPRQRQR